MSRTLAHETAIATDRVAASVRRPAMTSSALVFAVNAAAGLLECGSRFGPSAEWRASDCVGGSWFALGALPAPPARDERNRP